MLIVASQGRVPREIERHGRKEQPGEPEIHRTRTHHGGETDLTQNAARSIAQRSERLQHRSPNPRGGNRGGSRDHRCSVLDAAGESGRETLAYQRKGAGRSTPVRKNSRLTDQQSASGAPRETQARQPKRKSGQRQKRDKPGGRVAKSVPPRWRARSDARLGHHTGAGLRRM